MNCAKHFQPAYIGWTDDGHSRYRDVREDTDMRAKIQMCVKIQIHKTEMERADGTATVAASF